MDSDLMQKDLRETRLYGEAEALCKAVRQPGTGQISDAADINVSSTGKHAVFAATAIDKLEGTPSTHICKVDLHSAEVRVMTFGPATDRLPKYSPDSRHIAFLSDRQNAGEFQLYLLDPVSGAARSTPPVPGVVEYLHWSPNGSRIVIGVAGYGADLSSAQGAVTTKRLIAETPSWVPEVESGNESYRWRRAWIYELATGVVRQVSANDINVWEAVWCGNETLAMVESPGPGEGLWYSAGLSVIDVASRVHRSIYAPRHQLGWPTASPSGRLVAIIEAISSDRAIVAGTLRDPRQHRRFRRVRRVRDGLSGTAKARPAGADNESCGGAASQQLPASQ